MSVAAFLILRNGRNHTSGVPKIGESATPRVTLLRISHNLCVVTRGGNSHRKCDCVSLEVRVRANVRAEFSRIVYDELLSWWFTIAF